MMKRLFPFRPAEAVASPLRQHPGPEDRPVVLVSLLGVADLAAEPSVARHAAARGQVSVFVVTAADLRPVRDRGMVAEYLPPPEVVRGHPRPGDWGAYLNRKWRLIHEKWQPRWHVSHGLSFERYLQELGFAVEN